ncbi:N-fatty-acyl-amino acid synthase/hydrolase PM20D1.2 [Hyalella azteca]|uniref:N-fatty-acyl-amino acid synthase/hydrolase PM20D1.2 n=1 Tax=Hyalella azteca TaxID=294128 RepID=A0A8B7MZC9_HYAAZ|nr:N-fatty-acyl-amino acid synthase/hydrolase PM20D1.2 [Hyalella azteca]
MTRGSTRYSLASVDDPTSYSYSKEKRKCGRNVIYSICVIISIILIVIAALLVAALIRALMLEVPSYVHPSTMEQIMQLPNMSSSTFLNLPSILGMALTFPTITNSSGSYDPVVFRGFREFLVHSFPNVFSSSNVEVHDSFPSFLLTVQGSGENATANSFLLLGHMDVVPVDASAWDDDPFSGKWLDKETEGGGFVYGRGAIDDKLSVVAILCALDELIASGWSPNSTFYIAFGHDEEVGGEYGARRLANFLESKGVKDLLFILDEGMPILEGAIAGLEVPVAIIGVTEKGWMDIRVEATGVAGHSSIPPLSQATHALATAIHNLHSSPHPVFLNDGPEEHLLLAVAPKSSWPQRLALSNPWLFRNMISAVFSRKRETDAMQRTTTATTIISGGVKDNVVPGTAWALVNHRVHPSESLEEVVRHDISAINDDNINVTVLDSRAPHPISPYGASSPAFSLLASVALRVCPEAVPAPGVLVANTDTRHYLQFSRSVYRAMPYLLTPQDLAGIHGNNERISAANVWRAAQYYHTLIMAADLGLANSHYSQAGRGGREL